jgi:hypothetical protein
MLPEDFSYLSKERDMKKKLTKTTLREIIREAVLSEMDLGYETHYDNIAERLLSMLNKMDIPPEAQEGALLRAAELVKRQGI